MHSEAEALEHMKKRDRGHQSVSLENKTEDSTMVKMSEKNNNANAGDCMILDDHEGEEHCCGKGTNARSVSFLPRSQKKIGDSAKVVIKQDTKGGEHKYGFNNNKREKPEKVRAVDDETGDKHELYEVLRMPSRTKNRCLKFFTESRRGIINIVFYIYQTPNPMHVKYTQYFDYPSPLEYRLKANWETCKIQI
ncbi:hypothetical protein HKD37_01G001284 [Glycine soja]